MPHSKVLGSSGPTHPSSLGDRPILVSDAVYLLRPELQGKGTPKSVSIQRNRCERHGRSTGLFTVASVTTVNSCTSQYCTYIRRSHCSEQNQCGIPYEAGRVVDGRTLKMITGLFPSSLVSRSSRSEMCRICGNKKTRSKASDAD